MERKIFGNFLHNAKDKYKNGGWIFVRDHKYNLVYYGYVSRFSESKQERELLMKDVDIYSNLSEVALSEEDEKSRNPLYTVQLLYLARNRDDLTIEVPKVE